MKSIPTYKFIIIGKYVTISVECPTCDRIISFGVRIEDFKKYKDTGSADLAFPGILLSHRLMLSGGACDYCSKP